MEGLIVAYRVNPTDPDRATSEKEESSPLLCTLHVENEPPLTYGHDPHHHDGHHDDVEARHDDEGSQDV